MREDSHHSDLADLRLGEFTPDLGATFSLQDAAGQSLEVELVEARDLAEPGRPHGPRRPFLLLFRAPPGADFEQGTYRLLRPGRPPIDLFLVPMGPIEGGVGYEAVFH